MKIVFVSIVIFIKDCSESGFKIWVQERWEEGPLYKKLEFPGGKIEEGESPLDAAKREVLEEVGIDISKVSQIKNFKIQDYIFNNKKVVLNVFISSYGQLPIDKGQWLHITYTEKSEYLKGKIPPINHVILDELSVYLKELQGKELMDYLWEM